MSESNKDNYLSANHAAKNIRLHWEKAGFSIGDFPLGSNVGAEFGKDISNSPLASLFVFVDEYLALLRYASYYFLSAIPHSGQQAVLFNRLTVRQLRTVAAIRILCALGLDGNARMQLRLLYETSLLWVRFRVDDEAAKEFQSATSPTDSNAFWHKYISKEKNEKWLKSELGKSGLSWIGNMDEKIDELKLKISVSSHPTFLQAYFDSNEDLLSNDGFIIGQPSPASHFTLSMTLLATAIPFSLIPEPSYNFTSIDMRTRGPWHPIHTNDLDWEQYNLELRNMFSRLFLASIRFTNELGMREPYLSAKEISDSL